MMMNLLFVINNSINYGGAERYVSVLANALVKGGFRVVVIACDGPITKYLDRKIIHEKIEPMKGISKQDQLKIAKVIEKVCKKHDIDLIHCNSLADFRASSLIKNILDIPLIFTAHLIAETPETPIIGAELGKMADKVIAISNFIRTHLIKTGLFESKLSLTYHGIDVNKFKQRKPSSRLKFSLGARGNERIIMNVARLYPIKGIDQLIRAVPIILEKGNSIKVVSVGGGFYKDEYASLAKTLGINNKIVFLGARDDVEKLLSAADIFCLSSRSESLSLAILEAMAEGKPVVATKVGGIPEVVIDNTTGLLVPAENPQALANAINKLLEDKDLAKRLGNNGKERVHKLFKLDRMVNETIFTYQSVLEGERIYA